MIRVLAYFGLLLSLPLCAGLQGQQYGNASVIDTGPNCNLHGFLAGDASAPWNQVVTGYAISSHNAALHSTYGAAHLHVDWAGALYGPHGISYNCVDQTVTPFVPVAMVTYLGDSDTTLYPFYPSMAIEDGFPAWPFDPNDFSATADGGDHHGTAITRDGWNYETWRTGYGGGHFVAANGAVWDMTKYSHRPYGMTSPDAAGMPLFPYIIKYDEVATPLCSTPLNGGMVQTFCHASRITWNSICGAGYYSGDVVPGYVAPATHGAANTASTDCYLFEGARFRLRPDFDTSSFTGMMLTILNTWKTYGFSLNDRGGTAFVQGSGDARWDTNALLTLQAITVNDLDELDFGHPLYDDLGRPPQGGVATGLQPVPTGTAPSLTGSPTLSASTIVLGQTVTLTPVSTANASYTFIAGGLPLRNTALPVTLSPTNSTVLCQTSRNLYGSATACAPPLTVLIPPLVGVTAVGLR